MFSVLLSQDTVKGREFGKKELRWDQVRREASFWKGELSDCRQEGLGMGKHPGSQLWLFGFRGDNKYNNVVATAWSFAQKCFFEF